ncbi:MAG: 50S ribosomal protein L23 [Desulfovibrio sp.]|nr:50S ribosomal protein L23 [Desulfovibrio sp.]
MDGNQILIRPLLTEKVSALKQDSSRVAFFVHQDANKIEIKKAVEDAFKVKVDSVNIICRKPSPRKRQGRTVGRNPGWKKAYVKLASGEKIEFFEGV